MSHLLSSLAIVKSIIIEHSPIPDHRPWTNTDMTITADSNGASACIVLRIFPSHHGEPLQPFLALHPPTPFLLLPENGVILCTSVTELSGV